MNLLLTVLLLVLAAGMVAALWSVIFRRGVFNRIIGVGVVGTNATVILAITGVLFGRPDAFVDIALTYALLNFIATLVVAKYFTRQEAVQ